ITTIPSIGTLCRTRRMASTATPSAPSLSPRPIQRAPAIAAASVTRTSSRARFRSGILLGGTLIASHANGPPTAVLRVAGPQWAQRRPRQGFISHGVTLVLRAGSDPDRCGAPLERRPPPFGAAIPTQHPGLGGGRGRDRHRHRPAVLRAVGPLAGRDHQRQHLQAPPFPD